MTPTHNHSKALGVYIVACDRKKQFFLVTSRGSEDALDALLECGIDLDWSDVSSVRKVQGNVSGPRGAIYFGDMHVRDGFRVTKAPLAQLDRASEFYSEGCGSKSCGEHQS